MINDSFSQFLMFFNNGFWFYSMMGGWSTWQWVFFNSSQNFWSFDTPDSPGCASAVFVDNQSENEIWNRSKQFLPVWHSNNLLHSSQLFQWQISALIPKTTKLLQSYCNSLYHQSSAKNKCIDSFFPGWTWTPSCFSHFLRISALPILDQEIRTLFFPLYQSCGY